MTEETPPVEQKMDTSLKTAILTAGFILLGLFAYNFFFPDLSGMTVMEKCEYWSYRMDQGYGSETECKAEDALTRLRLL